MCCRKQCFGDAGCDLTYRISVNYVGAQTPDPTKTFTVTYNVTGGDSVATNHFSITGTQVSVPSEEIIQTPPNPTLTATPTNVLEG